MQIGYFDKPGQETPTYDPGTSIPCPICNKTLSDLPMVTISLMKVGDSRSYFFRAHKHCWNSLGLEGQSDVESQIIDGIN